MRAALLRLHGEGLRCDVQIERCHALEIEPPMAAAVREVVEGESVSLAQVGALSRQLAEAQSQLIGQLLAESRTPTDRVLAVGVHDPGAWSYQPGQRPSYVSLCDAALLAELSGLNVVDGFPARDMAGGGQGGPLTALPQWMLLRDSLQDRLLIDLGRTVELTFLPADTTDEFLNRVLSFQVGPGTQLLDQLVQHLTGGTHMFDPGGSLAVQGRQIPQLREYWLADPYFERPLPRWHPRGVRPERFVGQALQLALQEDWSVRDVLCSATHFLAETIVSAVGQRTFPGHSAQQILLRGGGRQNGLLLRALRENLAQDQWIDVDQLGYSEDQLEAACAALLAWLHIEQRPATHAALTAASGSRVLGRLTPGSAECWRPLVEHMSHWTAPLRRAG
jgi:anhydro-N-acetylmuramic acid kinase